MTHEPTGMLVDNAVAPDSKGLSSPSTTAKVPLLQQLFSFPAMLASCLVTAVFVARHNFEVDPDLWWHLKVGEDILSTHHWPTVDPYSFTVTGQPWLAYEWLGDVLIAGVARVAGLRGLQALLILLGAAIMLALYSYATLRSKNSKGSFVAVGVLLALACANFNLRPQMLGYLFLVLTLIALERFRQGKRAALWLLPPLFLLWINAHGSWVIGLAVILAYWLCGLKEFQLGDIAVRAWKPEERTRLSLMFLLCLAAIPITPYGTRLAAYPFQFASSLPLNLANIEEWRPIALNSSGPQLFLFLVLGTIFAQIAWPMRWRLEDVLLFVGGAGMTFVHARFLLLFVPFFSPVFATMLSRWVPKYQREKDHYVLNVSLMMLMLAGMILYFPSNAQIEKKIAAAFPAGAVRYLKDHPVAGPMYNSYDFGGYLVYREHDVPKVFIDGRGELYEPGGVLADYLYVSDLRPGVLRILNNYGIRFCMVRTGDPLRVFLTARPEWKQVYRDRVSVIVVRSDGTARRQSVRDR